jgi:predicted secreted protein
MAANNGTNVVIMINNRAVAYGISKSFSLSKPTIDVSSDEDADWTARIKGRGDWSCDFEGRWVPDADVTTKQSVHELINLVIAGNEVTIAFRGSTTGDISLEGNGFIEGIDLSAGDNDSATFSGNIVANGGLTVSTVS